MPTYVYQCLVCDQQANAVQRITDERLEIWCVACRQPMVRRIGVPGLVLKGVGLYKPSRD